MSTQVDIGKTAQTISIGGPHAAVGGGTYVAHLVREPLGLRALGALSSIAGSVAGCVAVLAQDLATATSTPSGGSRRRADVRKLEDIAASAGVTARRLT